MNFWGVDAKGDVVWMIEPCDRNLDERFVWLWNGETVSVLEHTKRFLPCK
jgi:hypothetical protein